MVRNQLIRKISCPSCKSDKIIFDKNCLSCKDCSFTFYINVGCASVGIVEYKKKILFVKRKYQPYKGYLHLPGGYIESGETAEEALYREIREETNLIVNNSNYLFSFPNDFIYKDIHYNVLDFYFHVKIDSVENMHKGSDADDILLLNKEEINISEIGHKSVKKAIKYFLNEIN